MSSIEINKSDRVFLLTGAGISAESGLPTFRASDGLWAGHRVEDVCTPEAWERNAELVWQFYSARREAAEKALPNPAHSALAELEAKIGDRLFLCTQNVDDLHEKAGSKRVVHMHEIFLLRGAARSVERRLLPIGLCTQAWMMCRVASAEPCCALISFGSGRLRCKWS